MLEKTYFTFGQDHKHIIGGTIYDKDCVVEIENETHSGARVKMFRLFGDKWSLQYDKEPNLEFFPRGIIKIN